ncbi:MAG: hypothetical protein WC476_01610 [Phycisphaerae bacterium]|jgi:hypothetical protein
MSIRGKVHFYNKETGKAYCGKKIAKDLNYWECAQYIFEGKPNYYSCRKCAKAIEKKGEKKMDRCNAWDSQPSSLVDWDGRAWPCSLCDGDSLLIEYYPAPTWPPNSMHFSIRAYSKLYPWRLRVRMIWELLTGKEISLAVTTDYEQTGGVRDFISKGLIEMEEKDGNT